MRNPEVHDALSSIEAEAERMFSAERRLMDGDAQERDRLYARAQQGPPEDPGSLAADPGCAPALGAAVNGPHARRCTRGAAPRLPSGRSARASAVSSKLAAVGADLASSVDEVNSLAATSLGDPETPLGAVLTDGAGAARSASRRRRP
ncbi:hypothetical protein MNEG_10631 [Monoraphidium neglectum]|uniref:Uncharacterized protein n=1 Tax=Monoraphidium neglectum TaxID=145388 RepID=A0A0D2M0Y8_9CHLO|nr:hypothetical protein MNEG_10631 [Monoraphidium neglectum]KIY97329.1 hypothetical protein MNEG_10631 [Monoraphidium neglectum]|eukprot:XP_013896349.1 hypothetical protein MNEG_10631 [Monoraphidium neglectum]